ncbi:MAG TPA: hypothetical protein VJJ23_05985 [Candidatus Nanoarchaeia archaeon]|nr:hypothetical protein [Candidatus Nanoarchaeia archaeon]
MRFLLQEIVQNASGKIRASTLPVEKKIPIYVIIVFVIVIIWFLVSRWYKKKKEELDF